MEGAEQPAHDAYVYAIRDEESYLQVDDEKQPTPPEPLDPASILCQFCGKSWEQVLAAQPPGSRGLHWWSAWSYRIRP